MEEYIIKGENISYKYSESDLVFAVKNVNLEVKKGEFLAILGRNGSGKSTIAKNFNGLFVPTEGVILVDNIDTRDEEKIWDIRQNVGMVFQNPDNQIVATVVEEDVAFGPENLGVPSEEIRNRVDSALNKVKMFEFKRNAPHLLSGGQKQRVAIAGILAMEPKCIIFDEATSMLDPSGRKEIMDIMKKLNKDLGITIITITHYMNEAAEADRIIVMDKGEIRLQGTPREIFQNVEEIKKIGLEVPQMTELAFELKKEGISINKDILSIDEMVRELCQLR
ncbi:Energy-coupling factor transporter ATP-binding protein EcfA1 [Clostridium bornimense]|uniref:Energy-coupling factor transporter ATP-binding protein EcfA1 n=1 Tax=Clostridium bornimense TaxID=1216932 RepID=W6RYM5_9CLOT|nr:energy-coupling factor transporter ATPase [Clostridium bornimense]CDM69558.1 Energy-coupling factor transporter ATP-binding protein EcfA1 [Clostridium bornimense]